MINFFKNIFFRNQVSEYGVCSICDGKFKDSQLSTVDELAFCSEHRIIFDSTNWVMVQTVTSDPSDPSKALKLQEIKHELSLKDISSYIRVSYLESNDNILSQFSLYITKSYIDEYTIHYLST